VDLLIHIQYINFHLTNARCGQYFANLHFTMISGVKL